MDDDWDKPLSPEEMRATLMYVRFNDKPLLSVLWQAIVENLKSPLSVIGILTGVGSLGSLLGFDERSLGEVMSAFFSGYRALLSGFFTTVVTIPFSMTVPEPVQDAFALYMLFVSIAVRDYQVVHAPVYGGRIGWVDVRRILLAPAWVPAQAFRYVSNARWIIVQRRYMTFSMMSFFVNLLATPALLFSGIAFQQMVPG
ncbi:hypothetical protein [Paracoccus fontiphilus]|uniref:Uncharacterized protein n=1 Tax=Paracoccus fontiphilus TaxID=1815556 RepID=A0ABV7IIQ9_9RHOB